MNFTVVVDAFARLTAAICSAGFAFVLWNLAARPLHQLGSDFAGALRNGGALRSGLLRCVVGAVFALLALALTATTVVSADADVFSVFAIAVFLCGLGLDAIIGDAVRTAIRIER